MWKECFPQEIRDQHSHLILCTLKVGAMFGEQSSISDQDSSHTVECCSKTAVVYKIHRSNFIQHFGQHTGVPATQIRAESLMNNNWIRIKMQSVKSMNKEQLSKLEWRDDSVYNKLTAVSKVTKIRETPYASMRADAPVVTATASDDSQLTEKQKKIAALKA